MRAMTPCTSWVAVMGFMLCTTFTSFHAELCGWRTAGELFGDAVVVPLVKPLRPHEGQLN